MKRVVSMILVLFMTAALFSGCGKSAGQNTTPTQATKSSGKVNEFGWEVPENTIVIDYYGGQGNPNDYDKFGKQMQDYLLKNFNVKLNKIVYDNPVAERLNLMLASNDYPGVLTGVWYDDVNKMAEMGKLQDLSPLVDKYAPDFKKLMGDKLNRYKSADGKLYKLAAGWGYMPIASYGANIRYDWYKEVGAPKFSTIDEYTNTLKQMVAKHPTTESGQKVYALGTSKDNRLYLDLAGAWGLKWGWKFDKDNNATSWINTDECVAAVKWVNQLYRDGLFDPDSFVQTTEEWGAKMTNQRYAGHLGRTWEPQTYGHEKWQKLLGDKWTDDMRYVPYDIHPANLDHSMLNPMNAIGWSFTVITDKCKNPEDVMKWINFENSDMGVKLLGWGIPNLPDSAWTLKDGKWAYNEPVKKAVIDQTLDWDKFNALGSWYYQLAPGVEDLKDGSNYGIDTALRNDNKWLKTKDENMKASTYDFSITWAVQIPVDDPVSVKKTQANDIVTTGYVQAIMAKSEAECVAKIMETRDKANKAGMKEYEAAYTKEYKRLLAAWGK